ncbi:hypothetical protein N0V82_001648 [Gnomoniopsis sp. IMI 355080]|nr:hypothetical protein N0V82_001648 [Gnomoniopsis sp. IMI 355080]
MRFLTLLSALLAHNGVLAAPRQTIPEERRIEGRALGPSVTITKPAATIQGRIVPYADVYPVAAGSLESFKQIPFAQPPVGQLRLKPPVSLNTTKNLGTIDASGLASKACPQQIMDINLAIPNVPSVATEALETVFSSPLINNSYISGQEDCLTLDVMRPSGTKAGDKLPVMLWIYGGGFELGSTAMYDGTSIVMRSVELGKPVVFVAMNYRVAGFGFLAGKEILADGSANLGLLDQRLAMQWVQDHVKDFGGDPDKVTLWGESAGAISIFDQLIAKGGDNTGTNGKPLFRGAIMNSGSAVPADPVDCPKAQAVYDAVVANAGCAGKADTLACLRSVPYETFLKASNSVPSLLSYQSLALSYIPRPDGTFLPSSPETVITTGAYAKVPYILGDQEDEGTLFALFTNNISTTDQIVDYLRQFYFNNPAADINGLVSLYPEDPAQGSPFRTGNNYNFYPQFKRIAALLGDAVFTLTRRVVLNGTSTVAPNVPSWSYLSVYDYGTPYLGTLHGSDILQVFYGVKDNYAANGIMKYFLNFAYNLDPNNGSGGATPLSLGGVSNLIQWPQWSKSNTLLQFDANSFNTTQDNFRPAPYQFLSTQTAKLRF